MPKNYLLALLGCSFAMISPLAFSDDAPISTGSSLQKILDTPENQWVFNHLCIPTGVIGESRYSNADFVDAYLLRAKNHWVAAQEALKGGDDDASSKQIAPILHSVIDAYWPGRLLRDESGAITAFRTCEEFGQLQGLMRQEHGGGEGPTGAAKDLATANMAQLIRKWKEGRPFEEAEVILRAGPLHVAANALAGQLPQNTGPNTKISQSTRSQAPTSMTLVVNELDGNYKLSVPVSRLVMTLPRATLSQVTETAGGATQSPRYFHFSDSTRGLALSGWFEGGNSFPGFDSFWKQQTDAWHAQGLPEPQNVARASIGGWDLVTYDIALPAVNDAHIRAEWVQDGTWIDLHISAAGKEPIESLRNTVMNALKDIKVTAAP
jgi:hypothetical protein